MKGCEKIVTGQPFLVVYHPLVMINFHFFNLPNGAHNSKPGNDSPISASANRIFPNIGGINTMKTIIPD